MMSDPIADMLTRVRNANAADHRDVNIPWSKMKEEMARLLKAEGYIAEYSVSPAGPGKLLTLGLKPRTAVGRALSGLRRISKPGLRVYAGKASIPRVLGGLGISILSTSRGLMTGSEAQRAGLGGEVIAYVW